VIDSSSNPLAALVAAVLPVAFVRKAKVLGTLASQNYRRSQITRMAAALSFRTLFGLIPILVVGLVVVHRFVPQEKMRESVGDVLRYTGIAQIEVDRQKMDPEAVTQTVPGLNIFGGSMLTADPAALVQAQAAMTHAVSQAKVQSERLDDWITKLLDRIDGVNFSAIGWIGAIMLIYAAMSMVVEIEKAFNQIAQAPTGKSWLRRVSQYWALLTLGPLLLLLTFWIGRGVEDAARAWLSENAFEAARGPLLSTIAYLVAIPISTLTLAIVYTSIPNARVQVSSAVLGALFAAVLWEGSKWAFRSYVHYSSNYAVLYGAIALLPLFLLWVYVTWMIVLLGFQVAMTLQTYRSISKANFRESVLIALGLAADPLQRAGGLAGPASVRLLAPSAALRCVCAVAERFAEGKPALLPVIAERASLDEPLAREVLERLADAGLLHRVVAPGASTDAPSVASYALARAPESLLVSDVLALLEGTAVSMREGAAAIVRAVKDAQVKALGPTTIADLQLLLVQATAPPMNTTAPPPALPAS
jgi:membrane protein